MKTTKHNPSVKLLFSDASGVYIPKRFATEIKRGAISGVKPEDLDYLARGPGGCLDESQDLAQGESVRGEYYWDIWETYRDWETDRKSTRLNSSHSGESRMPSSA